MSRNPYEVLGLPAGAGEADAVRQGARLTQQGADDEVREAVRRLTADAAARELFALLTPPGPVGIGAELERFVAAHRRPPAGLPLAVPPLDEAQLRGLVRAAVAAGLEPRPEPLAAVPAGEAAEEVGRQTGEALWQSLLHDMRG
ncbi:MAG: hypothetical protein ACRC33_26735 [Gemmataceae bacterium]